MIRRTWSRGFFATSTRPNDTAEAGNRGSPTCARRVGAVVQRPYFLYPFTTLIGGSSVSV